MTFLKLTNRKGERHVQKYFYKLNANNRINRIVREVYLRNDISCGIEKCNVCENNKKKLLDGERNILILDLNTLIKYMDFLYDCDIDNILIPLSIYDYIKSFNKILYKKLRNLCYDIDEESIIEGSSSSSSFNHNKRFCVFVNTFCKFTYVEDNKDNNGFKKELQEIIKIVIWLKHHNNNLNIKVISNNKLLQEDCYKNDIPCSTLFEYLNELMKGSTNKKKKEGKKFNMDTLKMYFEEDILNEYNDNKVDDIESINEEKTYYTLNNLSLDNNHNNDKRPLYEPHLNKSDMIQKLRENKIIKGVFSVICVNKLALVKFSDLDEIVIRGTKYMNRAIHNDIVAVEIIDEQNDDLYEEDYLEEQISPEDEEEEEQEEEIDVKAEVDVHIDVNVEGVGQKDTIEINNIIKDKRLNGYIKNEDIKEKEHINNIYNKQNNYFEKDIINSYENKMNVTYNNQMSEKKKLYGKVVGIISRCRKEYGGIIKEYSNNLNNIKKKLMFFKAFNNKIPYIMIKAQLEEELRNKRVIVTIDNWDIYSRNPLGRCISVLGNCDDIETETKLIYNEYNISTREFSENVYKCLPPNNWVIPEEEYAKRSDFRNVLTFSIDPPGCQDIDDALSVEFLKEEGNIEDDYNNIYRIGVHIADVSYFVKQNSPIDLEASKRCTTVYLINQRVDMLPKLLTTNLCSLVEGEERLTYSCIFCFNKNFDIIDISVKKCIIKSNKSFSYEEAQNVIDDKNDESDTAKSLRLLNKIAKHLKEKWLNDGALELRGNTEVLFEFEANDFSKAKNLKPYVCYETNKLIEAFMLLANRSVARIIFQNFKAASVLRRHPPPKHEYLKELNDYLKTIQVYDFKYNTSKELSHSINNINLKNDNILSNILKVMVTKCMNEAVFISGYNVHNNDMLKHYGLAADIYTFFTSPIRRYADIMVHRILNHIYQIEQLDTKYLDIIYLNKQVALLNEKYRNARFASRASVDFFSYLYIKKIGNQITKAVITNLKKNGIQIFLIDYSTEGICYLKRKDGFLFDEKKKRFIKIDKHKKELFHLSFYDKIQVHMQVDNYDIKCQNHFIFIKKI
ncbi:exosome complex exonuclease RRP44 [Plasmodium sp. gorilla clade G2]|uniref:exosome complex exonuclease RRP44 n=1 Tax=Plasmodium sp. gorilla clade G2 TaxID=880535 RepID=UPI000D22622C|nr:exosome complex exonuclease RRP44 [Plasmodium sp. gorilla clade G2]SOV18413.1 exosome complex exonuclease RRP44 [Plasmodium sp. gorilla clade G2]